MATLAIEPAVLHQDDEHQNERILRRHYRGQEAGANPLQLVVQEMFLMNDHAIVLWSRPLPPAESCDGSPMLQRVDVWQFVEGRAYKLSDSHSLRASCGHDEHDRVMVADA